MIRKVLPCLALGATLAAAASAQTVDELVAKNIEARGGLAKIRAVSSVRMTGKVSMGQMELPIVVEMKRPASFRTDATFQGSTAVQAYDGKQGWSIPPMGTQPEAMPADAAKEVASQADLDGPLVDYKAKGNQIELLGKVQLDGKDAYKLRITRKEGAVETYFLDASTFLVVRAEAKRTIGGAEIEGESTIEDYREAGGVMWPSLVQNGAKGQLAKQTIRFDKIEVNPVIDDSRFRMPTARPAEPPKRD